VASSAESTARIEAAKTSGIRFIQLQFTDIIGHVKAVTIPIHQLEGSVKHGTWFDGSSIEGFTRIAESDQYLMPDMATFAEIPWQKGSGERGTARVICDVFTPAGEPFVGDPRGVLRRQVERAKKLGYVVNTGPELEFFLFRRGEDGGIEPLPHDQAGYFDFSTDLAQEIRQDMVDALEAFGIRVEAAHHEVAVGHDQQRAVHPGTELMRAMCVCVVDERPGARRRERGDERIAGRDHRREVHASTAPSRDAVVEALQLDAVPVHRRRLGEPLG
jgi:glutamine synthetase